MIRYLLVVLTFILLPVSQALALDTAYVSEDNIAQAIKKEFVERYSDDEIELEIYGGQTNFSFENVKQIKLMVANAKFDELQNKFSANVEIFADGKPMASTALQGKYYVLGEIYVPAQNINKGETITADKLKTIKVRSNRIKPQNLVDKDKLVNMEAKRNLREGKIINDKDVGRVILIKKGEIINCVYQNKSMQISAKAEALEDGYRGQKIEVRNTKSKKSIFGDVIDAETVVVNPQ